ncbi:hypothetical protein CHU32_20440 [Superficieibacter electus]|uniref:SinI protein n=1 Tax=Superficieibacter electus TaxID=2022662 RepID=A0A2P5GKM9_9ENTR|nr:SinI family autotransporter-associated protein [Superficieibacter electus]POP45133.1 hypothetical protein CHU32_20440 [Superficieibacter electus]
MKSTIKQRLSKVALALAVAGYCAIPSAMAAGEGSRGNLKQGNWQSATESTGTIKGTPPWFTRADQPVGDGSASDTNKDHVTVAIDRGARTATTPGEKQFHVGDKITISWALGDTELDIDTDNIETKKTVQWVSFSDQNGGDPKPIGTVGSDTYTIQDEDADRYIGVRIQSKTTTGDPAFTDPVLLKDLSTNAGGGADDDDIPEGPVVDENVHVVIHEEGQSTNLLGSTANLKTNTTYQVLLWKDLDGDNTYDGGDENVTDNYNYRWRFTGTSGIATGQGSAGIVNSKYDNNDLVIPVTNAQAKTEFEGAENGVTVGTNGVQGFGLSVDYQRK